MADKIKSGYCGQVVLVILTGVFACGLGKCVTDGTTLKIKEIILGRCLDFQENLHPEQFCDDGQSTLKNCTELNDIFLSSFAYRPSCNVTYDRFDDFIQAAGNDVTSGKAMFWSGTGDFAHSYSDRGKRYTTLEDTLIGHMVDKLTFCGQESAPGINFDGECAGFYPNDNCTHPAMYSFWAMASKNFASTAQGEATVLLNGSRSEPFRLDSFFATWEVPNMDPSKLTRLNIFLINTPGQKIESTCQSDNIRVLTQRLSDRNINYKCVDSPRGPQAMFCVDYPDVEECKGATTTDSAINNNISAFYVIIYFMSLTFMLL